MCFLFLCVRVGLQKEAELLSASWIDRFSSFAANQEFGFFLSMESRIAYSDNDFVLPRSKAKKAFLPFMVQRAYQGKILISVYEMLKSLARLFFR